MALPKIHVGEKTERRLKRVTATASILSVAALYIFPIGALAMGFGFVSYLKRGEEYPNQHRRLKRLRSLLEDTGELAHRGFEIAKSPWVAIGLAGTALLVFALPLVAFYVPTVFSTVSYGVAGLLAAPAAALALPASVHHFRSLKRAQERNEGHRIRAFEVQKGERSVGEHVAAEVGDAVAVTKWTVGKAVGAATGTVRALGWTGRTWKSSWATSPTVRLGGKVLGSSLTRLGTGARFVGHAVTLHHYRSLKAEVVELRAKVQTPEATVAKVEQAPQATAVGAAALTEVKTKQRSTRGKKVEEREL